VTAPQELHLIHLQVVAPGDGDGLALPCTDGLLAPFAGLRVSVSTPINLRVTSVPPT
jgi:hypothetical protein